MRRIGWLFAFTSALIFSTNSPIAKNIISAGMEPVTLATLRFVLASVFMAVVVGGLGMGKAKGEEKPLNRRIIIIAFISGIINGFTIFAWYSSLSLIDASLAVVLGTALFPTMTLLLLALAGEKLTGRKLIRLALVFIGLYFLIAISNTSVSFLGLIYVLIGAFMYAIHLISVQWYMKPYNTWAMVTIITFGSAFVVVFLWYLNGSPTFVPGWQGWLVVAYQAVVLSFLGRAAMYAAIDRIGTGQFALLTPLETVMSLSWAFLFLGERLTQTQWFGAALILLSATLAADFSRKKQADTIVRE